MFRFKRTHHACFRCIALNCWNANFARPRTTRTEWKISVDVALADDIAAVVIRTRAAKYKKFINTDSSLRTQPKRSDDVSRQTEGRMGTQRAAGWIRDG
jgi:hypothetical protein